MREFRFLDYYTRYSAKGYVNKSLSTESCFGEIYKALDTCDLYNEDYVIYIYKGINRYNKGKSNMCFLNKIQLYNHIKQAKGIYDFKFKIIEEKNKFKVYLYVTEAPGTFHKYILAWIRYCYEFPYNMLLLDALEIKKEHCFKYTSISNLFNLVLGCYNNEWDWLRTIHQIPIHQVCIFLRKKEIFKKLQVITELNNIYKFKDVKKYYIPKKHNGNFYFDLAYWKDEKCLEVRKSVYKKLYINCIRKKK